MATSAYGAALQGGVDRVLDAVRFAPVRYGIMGPVEVVDGDRRIDLGAPQHRVLLARLLLSPNRVVSTESLAAALWEDAEETNVGSVRVYVSRLRKLLGDERAPLVTRTPGYVLCVEDDELDADRFRDLAAAGRERLAAGDVAGAAAALAGALAMWRGPALADVADREFARAASVRLEEDRLAVLEDRVEADLALGRHSELAGELSGLTTEHPERERLWRQRMIAEYRSGQPARALRTFQDLRTVWNEELGLEPGPEARRLERAILDQDADLDLATPTTAMAPERPAEAGGPVTRVMLVDDHPLWRSVIKSVLDKHDRFDVVGEADDGMAAVEHAALLRPDVVLMDLHLPGFTGAEAAARIVASTAETKVLMLSASGDEHDVLDAVRAGASGYLLKSGDADDVVDSLDRIARGEPVFTPALAALVLHHVRSDESDGPGLTTRQRDVLRALADGATVASIGSRLGIDDTAVSHEIAGILERLQTTGPGVGTGRLVRAVVFLDVVGSTERAGELGDRAWADLLDRLRAVVDRIADEQRGRVVKHIGDGSLVTFEQPDAATEFAKRLIRGAGDLGIALRVGIHVGECEVGPDDVHGMAVHIAARVQGRAEPNEILVSHAVRDLMIGSDRRFEDRGTHDLKGVPGEWRLFALAP